MKLFVRALLCVLGFYAAWLAFNWIWYAPTLVTRRVDARIRPGLRASDVTSIFGSGHAFDVTPKDYCSPKSSEVVSRLSSYTPGGLSFFIMSVPTTVTFCYDKNDTLVAFQAARWVDGP